MNEGSPWTVRKSASDAIFIGVEQGQWRNLLYQMRVETVSTKDS
jgi:hypothetical protein